MSKLTGKELLRELEKSSSKIKSADERDKRRGQTSDFPKGKAENAKEAAKIAEGKGKYAPYPGGTMNIHRQSSFNSNLSPKENAASMFNTSRGSNATSKFISNTEAKEKKEAELERAKKRASDNKKGSLERTKGIKRK